MESLLEQKIRVPTTSPYNTPINPVEKPGRNGWRFTQDLRAINEVVTPLPPIVPNIPSVLTAIPAHHTHFTVVDLCQAFFSVPVHPDTQPLFAFTYKGRQYTWTRLPQGYVDSPAAFSAVVRDTLDSFTPPLGCTLIQYVNDLLLTAETEELCKRASSMLLTHLAEVGHKVSLSKVQWRKPEVTYLGFILSLIQGIPGVLAQEHGCG